MEVQAELSGPQAELAPRGTPVDREAFCIKSALHVGILAKSYETAKAVEEKWYASWLKNRTLPPIRPEETPPYSLVSPPPMSRGVLTLGHVLNNADSVTFSLVAPA